MPRVVASLSPDAPDFSFERLSPLLPPFEFEQTREVCEEIAAYQRYYQIDLGEQIGGVSQKSGWLELEGYRIAVNLFQPAHSKGTVFVLHGYYDHCGLYGHAFRFWLEQGFTVLAYDLPGHGISSGARVAIDCFSEYRKVLKSILDLSRQQLPEPWYLMGQSTGGAIITDYLTHEEIKPESSPIKEVILLSPLVRPVHWKKAALQYLLVNKLIKAVPRKFGNNTRDENFKKFVRGMDPLQSRVVPVSWVGALRNWIKKIEHLAFQSPYHPAVVQGDNDSTVDWRHNMEVLKRLYAAPDILILPGAGHHLVNETSETRNDFFRFISDKLSL
ncbi:alpha/beta hydrolase [Spongorhabdus nitratireducens]